MASRSQAQRVRRWAIVLCAGLLSGCGDGWRNKVPSSAELTASRRDVGGSVVNASTLAPVVAAVVSVGGQQVSSGADGSFALTSVPRIDATLTVIASGFQSQVLTLGATEDLLTVRLVPNGGGPVVTPPGTPTRAGASQRGQTR